MDLCTMAAQTILDRHQLSASDVAGAMSGFGGRVWELVRDEVSRLSAAEQGIIGASGRGYDEVDHDSRTESALYHVHCGTWLDNYASGKWILLNLATTAVVARMDELSRLVVAHTVADMIGGQV